MPSAGRSPQTQPLPLRRKRKARKRKGSEPRTVAIVGTGLIGASIGLAMRARSARSRVIGYDHSRAATRTARTRGAITSVASNLATAVREADVIVLAVPEKSVIALLADVLRYAPETSLVIDVAGLKTRVVGAAAPLLARRQKGPGFVGGHPLAGREVSGAAAASATLFHGRPFALCAPSQARRSDWLAAAERFVSGLGALPVRIAAEDHDRIIAATSALPQIAASAAVLAVADTLSGSTELTGPGFSSVTRLASSPAYLWAPLLVANKRHVAPALSTLITRIRDFHTAIQRGDGARLARLIRNAASAKRRLNPH